MIGGRTNRLHLLNSENNRRITLQEGIFVKDAPSGILFSKGGDLVPEDLVILANAREGLDEGTGTQ